MLLLLRGGAAPIAGSVVWGHVTGVTEDNVRTFAAHWMGTASIAGAGDAETMDFNATEEMVSEVVFTDTRHVELLQNQYDPAGDNVTLQYRHAATEAGCLVAAWNAYVGPFLSDGYVQVKAISTL